MKTTTVDSERNQNDFVTWRTSKNIHILLEREMALIQVSYYLVQKRGSGV